MKYEFELTPFEKELKAWYTEHQETMPWDLFLIREKTIRGKNDLTMDPYHAIDPCYRQYENAIYDKTLGLVDFKDISTLASGKYCMLTKQPRYFPSIPFQVDSSYIFYAWSGISQVLLSYLDTQKTFTLSEGDFLFVPRKFTISLLCNSDTSILLYLTFSPRFFRQAPADMFSSSTLFDNYHDVVYDQNRIYYYSTGKDPQIHSVISSLLRESIEQKDNYQLMLYYLLHLLIAYLQREYQNICLYTDRNEHSYISQFQEYIRHHFADFSLQKMADDFHLSAPHICRLYKQNTGTTLLCSVRKMRIWIAKYLLKNTVDSIEDIAFQVGYTDTSYFIELFRKQTGYTPYHFRKR